jgi:hypothetical protein
MSRLLASPRGSRLAAGRRIDRPLDGELWINFGKDAVMVDPKANFVAAGERAVICDHSGKLRLVWGPLPPCEAGYEGDRKVLMKARKLGSLTVRDAVTLVGRVVPFVPRWIGA